jgi:hypothetical protein
LISFKKILKTQNKEEEKGNINLKKILKNPKLSEGHLQANISKASLLISVKNLLNNRTPNAFKKIKNKLIKKKLVLTETPKKLSYYRESSSKDGFTTPLNNKYKLLISNTEHHRRCFRNLSNEDFDNIFNDKFNPRQSFPISCEKILFPKSEEKPFKYYERNKNAENKKNNGNTKRISTFSNYGKNINNFIIKSKSKKYHKYKILRNISNFNIGNNNDNNYFDYKNNFIKKVSDRPNEKFGKFIFLLKKQAEKNAKLLSDIKRQEILSKDLMLVQIAKIEKFESAK